MLLYFKKMENRSKTIAWPTDNCTNISMFFWATVTVFISLSFVKKL